MFNHQTCICRHSNLFGFGTTATKEKKNNTNSSFINTKLKKNNIVFIKSGIQTYFCALLNLPPASKTRYLVPNLNGENVIAQIFQEEDDCRIQKLPLTLRLLAD